MGSAAGDDDEVLDLSLKKSSDLIIADSTVPGVLHDVVHASSSFNALSAAEHGSEQRPRVSLVHLPSSSISNGSSSVPRTANPPTCMTSLTSSTAARLLSHSVATNSRFQLSFSSLTYSHHPRSTAVETSVQCPSSFDVYVPQFSSSTTTHRTAMPGTCDVTADAVTHRLKRRRVQIDEASCTRSERPFHLQLTDSETSQQSASTSDLQSSMTTSEPVITPQLSDDVTDYIERRRKNNEAAKRSRDTRRLKEQETALRAAALEHDNLQLRAELVLLRTQAAKLHSMLYSKLGV